MHEGVMKDNSHCFTDDPIHEWFGLSYARYLTIPRTALQSMPCEWQVRFTRCLKELDYAIDWVPEGKQYYVQLRDAGTGRIVPLSEDPLNNYDRGRRKIGIRGKPVPYAKCDHCGRMLGTKVLAASGTPACGCGGTYRLVGPSSNGRTPGCEPGEVGSIPTGPSRLTFHDVKAAVEEMSRAIVAFIRVCQVVAYLRDMDVAGTLNYMRNWLEIYGEAKVALGSEQHVKRNVYVLRIRAIRATGFCEVW